MHPAMIAAISAGVRKQPQVDSISSRTSDLLANGGTIPSLGLRFNSNGDIEISQNGGSYITVGQWLNRAPSTPSDWEVLVSVDSEDADGFWTGTTGSYVGLGITRTFIWSKDDDSFGSAVTVFDVTVRNASTTSNSATVNNVTYTCETSF